MKKLETYLVGSIQDADNPQASREVIEAKLEEMGFGVLNPCKMECNHSLAGTIEEQKVMLHNLKKDRKWDKFNEVMDDIIDADMQCVSRSSFLTVVWDSTKRHGGTIDEILTAIAQSKEILVILKQPIEEMNDWILRRLGRANAIFFEGEQAYLDYLWYTKVSYIQTTIGYPAWDKLNSKREKELSNGESQQAGA